MAVKTANQIAAGDRFVDKSGTPWTVTEVRHDPFAPTARWIVIRVRNNEGLDTEICCTSGERFEMATGTTSDDDLLPCSQSADGQHGGSAFYKEDAPCFFCGLRKVEVTVEASSSSQQRIPTFISHDEDDGIDNADGTGFVAVSGPALGCLGCHAEVSTRWTETKPGHEAVECQDCLTVLAEVR